MILLLVTVVVMFGLLGESSAGAVLLTVQVLDEESGKPLMGAQVTVVSTVKGLDYRENLHYRETKYTDEYGQVAFSLPTAGSYRVEASHPEYENHVVEFSLSDEIATYSVSMNLRKGGTMGTAQISEFPAQGKGGVTALAFVAVLAAVLLLGARSVRMGSRSRSSSP